MAFKDHFSERAAQYAAYRPLYPAELASFLADAAPGRELAWDCGCGTGQLSLLLAQRFRLVVATDASERQIANATPASGVDYACAPAEASPLADASADLVVAAQAAHWFDLPAFYAEARRVARPGAVIALVTYGILMVDEALDPIIGKFYWDLVGPHWPPERRHVEDGYRSLDFPFPEIKAPALHMSARWTLDGLKGYFSTWSAVQAAERAGLGPAIEVFLQDLGHAWGDPATEREVRWPLALRVGTIG